MTKKILKNIKFLKELSILIKPAHFDTFNEIIEMYRDRKIKQLTTAENLIMKLANSRGKGKSTIIKKVSNISQGKSITKLKQIRTIQPIEPIQQIQPKSKKFHITADFDTIINYQSNLNKTKWDKNVPHIYSVSKTIEAENIDQAKEEFIEQAKFDFRGQYARGFTTIKQINYLSIIDESKMKSEPTEEMWMTAAKPVTYSFLPEVNDMHNKDNGFCVFDTFIGTYSKYIKKLTKEKFIKLCMDTIKNDFDDLDNCGIMWDPSHGVTPNMLFEVCKVLHISHYSFDVTNKCFLKYVSENRNYPALVYYAINNHMFHINNKEDVKKLVSKTLKIENRIVSSIIQDEYETVNIYKEYPMIENIPIQDIQKLAKSIKKDSGLVIMYTSTNNLENQFEDIIRLYNIIPLVVNKKDNIIKITPFKKVNMFLVVDPNYTDDANIYTYKKVQELCKTFNIEFKNQTVNGLISEVKTNFYNPPTFRHKFTKSERQNFYAKSKNCSQCQKEVKISGFHLDHIKALANGGSNEDDNIQMLCIPCHIDKTNSENEKGYKKVSDTESSFNKETRSIFTSKDYGSFAFVDNYVDENDSNSGKIYSLDINKCRRNIMLHNKEDYPVFTVLDKVEPYVKSKKIKTGVYFVETKNYFPMRGNRWYHHTMIKYCLAQNIIEHSNIKFQLLSSVSLKADYFNNFIEFLSEKLIDDKDVLKLVVNSMVGKFKPKKTENWSTLCIQENSNDVFYHFLNNDGCFIKNRIINDKTYYHAYRKYTTEKDESEHPIYHQILELEAIELHKMSQIIKSNNGIIVDLNTDAISFITKNDDFLFELASDGININGYFWDSNETIYKYKLEDKDGRLCTPKLQGYKSEDKYVLKNRVWKITKDVEDNDFTPLVNSIINPDTNKVKSCLIEARAGTGKSYLVKEIQKKLDSLNIKYITLSPTNVACININGITISKWINTVSKNIKNCENKVIIVDEIGMVGEQFLKFFSTFQRMKPNVKFILSGNYEQLEPVCDRVNNADYENSPVTFELSKGNRISLTKCRRSDDRIFNMTLPENIDKINPSEYGKTLCKINLSWTNETRKTVNKALMKRFSKNKHHIKVDKLSYDENSQDVTIYKGLPIISRKTCKIQDDDDENIQICKNEMFKVKRLANDMKTVDIVCQDRDDINFTLPTHLFNIYFKPAYAITVHSSQGLTIKEGVTIHEFDRFDNRMKYVAISRLQNVNQLNFM